MNTLAVGDLVLWKGIEMTVVSVTAECIFANSCDEGQSTRVMDSPSAFTSCNPPAPPGEEEAPQSAVPPPSLF